MGCGSELPAMGTLSFADKLKQNTIPSNLKITSCSGKAERPKNNASVCRGMIILRYINQIPVQFR